MKRRKPPESDGLRILGVMTGTSCDGLDAACMNFTAAGWKMLWSESRPYPAELRKRVLAVQKPDSRHTLREILELNRDLGIWYGKAIRSMRKNPAPHVIANHGQTVSHFPQARALGTTLQLGEPSRIAEATGLTVVSHFRDGDMAAGGQGAPLVPRFHHLLAMRLSRGQGGIAIHNLGGISNLSYVGKMGDLLAFDTGPANIWIDAAVERATGGRMKFDRGGKMALSGQADPGALEKLLRHPFFALKPPKSTGRDDFPPELFWKHCRVKGADSVATATALTVESIARSYEAAILKRGLPLKEIHLCGGGARNLAILEGLRARLPKISVSVLKNEELDPQFIEAQAFAVFGHLSLKGESLGGSWTGARGFAPAGMITPGANWAEVLQRLARS